MPIHGKPLRAATFVFSLATALTATLPAAAQMEWSVQMITTDAQTPLHHDVRRIMAAGYYDAAASQTFVSFTGTNMVPLVAGYDHASDEWSDPISVSMQPPTTDVHDYSHIFSLPDGHVGLTTSLHNEELYFARSENPHSIDGDWTVMEIGDDLRATYPMPMVSQADGSISILYRETTSITDYRPIKIVRSTDNGETWSTPQSAIDSNNSRSDYLNEVYLGAITYESDHPNLALGDGYHGTWTIAGGGGPDFGHRHGRFHKNMYYAFYNLSDQNWYAADGTNLGTNISDADAETHALVFDSGMLEGRGDLGELHDVGFASKGVLDSDGNPLVAFQNGKTNSIDIARWDGNDWNVTTPATFEGTRSLHDLAVVDGKVWLMERQGRGSRVVELQPDGMWSDVAFYNPDTNTSDNFFIDNGHPEALILSLNGNSGGVVYAISSVTADYNGNGTVDTADYTLWRDSLGSTTNLTADGNADGMVNNEDYLIWKRQFGSNSVESAALLTHTPEPSSALLMTCLAIVRFGRSRSSRFH